MSAIVYPGTSMERAQEIMGRNCGFDVVMNFGEFSKNERAQFEYVQFSEEALRARYFTSMLRAVPRISICEMMRRARSIDPKLCHHTENAWFSDQEFANDPGKAHVSLIGKERVYGSLEKTWDQQQVLLLPNEFVPSARDLIYAIYAQYFASNNVEWILGCGYVRCADVCPDGQHVAVSFTYGYGITLLKLSDDRRFYRLGLASAVKHGS